MKISAKSNKPFESHPEYTGSAVCVDVTPLKTVQSKFGPREQFRFVFETTALRDDGKPYLVWSRGFTPSLNEKSALRAFLKQWLGRDLSADEENELDTELFIGRPAHLVIVHNTGTNGEVYSNIALVRPSKESQPLKPSGNYVRVKDRAEKDANFKRVEQPADSDGKDEGWRMVQVHVGRHAGIAICDLDRQAIVNLYERWLPMAKENPKPLKADLDLIAALEKAAEELGITKGDGDLIPF